jgi:hypothetical protein
VQIVLCERRLFLYYLRFYLRDAQGCANAAGAGCARAAHLR